ncbi:hypothetical protein KIM67_16675 [Flagellimonas sp. 389]|uniref:DUF6090 family protein n=1 Tax=Flagellimonas sp. 389 TaxID=2835862 RepID=UPI001BD68307|nr:DUF6090 family protein [Flagellimonas sp. 389]MBS9464058.1 hypothetical protein [Flagellimonas sp. 389]
MIKFFRRLRKKSFVENKFSKYLLYAIGEIVLVVIGILIALQINNRSEFKKERKQEILLLSNLANEIGLDIRQIENNTKLSTERLTRLDSAIHLLENPTNIDKSSFISKSFEFVFDNYFKSNSGIFDEAVSSGKMSYIQNEQLRQDIFDYYRNANESDNDGTTRQVTDELITPIFVETLFMNPEGFATLGMSVQNIADLESIDFNVLKGNRDFWKMVLLKFGSNREQMVRWERIALQAQDVKQQINKELSILNN